MHYTAALLSIKNDVGGGGKEVAHRDSGIGDPGGVVLLCLD
jgi:hypothetical protein